jgi:hypothetical protein
LIFSYKIIRVKRLRRLLVKLTDIVLPLQKYTGRVFGFAGTRFTDSRQVLSESGIKIKQVYGFEILENNQEIFLP